MTDEAVLPRRISLLGEAMTPVLVKLRTEIAQPISATAPVGSMIEVISAGLNSLQSIVHRLNGQVNALMSDVVAKEDASDADVYRAVGRFEAFLGDLLSEYQGLKRLNAHGADIEGRDLLAGAYRHTLVQIQGWLQDLVDTLADPQTALRRKGLPTTGPVEIPLTLHLTGAPELVALGHWGERQSGVFSSSRNSGLGFWGTVGALALGWGIGNALFGDDDCGCNGGS